MQLLATISEMRKGLKMHQNYNNYIHTVSMPGCGYTGVPNNLRPFIKAFIIKLVTARQIIICIRATSMFF